MIIPFRTHGSAFEHRLRHGDSPPIDSNVTGRLTLPDFYYERLFEPRKARLSSRTIDSDVDAMTAWQVYSDNIDLYSLRWSTREQGVDSLRTFRAQLQKFVSNQLATGKISGVSINTRLRHIRTILRAAADPIEHGLIDHVPDLGRQFTGSKSAWQIKCTRLKPRETITAEEMVRLFHATEAADDPHLWKVIILLLWTYGCRTEDQFFRLVWSLINFQRMLMQFTANKTSKLQGVPLTPLIVRALLSLSSASVGDRAQRQVGDLAQQDGSVGDPPEHCDRPLFGKLSRGSWSKGENWKKGYYTTWSRDILPAGRFAVNRGPEEHQQACRAVPDCAPNLMFHHFRKTMVTELNIYSGQAGNWVAAHYISGVSEVYYDMPTERICTAVHAREAERLPDVWKDYFAEVPPHESTNTTSNAV
jgi:hypothetical protein